MRHAYYDETVAYTKRDARRLRRMLRKEYGLTWTLVFWRDIARFCNRYPLSRFVARAIWRRQWDACDLCGARVGMNSVVSRIGFTCWPCREAHKTDVKTNAGRR